MTSRAAWRERVSKRMRALIRDAESQGWEVTATAKSHIRFRSPSGKNVIVAARGGDLDAHYVKTVKRLKDRGLR